MPSCNLQTVHFPPTFVAASIAEGMQLPSVRSWHLDPETTDTIYASVQLPARYGTVILMSRKYRDLNISAALAVFLAASRVLPRIIALLLCSTPRLRLTIFAGRSFAIHIELSSRRTQRRYSIIDFFLEAAKNFSAYWTLAHQARHKEMSLSFIYYSFNCLYI